MSDQNRVAAISFIEILFLNIKNNSNQKISFLMGFCSARIFGREKVLLLKEQAREDGKLKCCKS